MGVKTLFFKNAVVNGVMSLQDGGSPPNAITTTGWVVGKLAAGNFALMAANTERASTTFATTDALALPAFTAASCWRSEQPFNGGFANTDWTLNFRVRAASAASSQTGRVNCRVWKSPNADGSGAIQLTSATLVGSTTTALSQSTPVSSIATWHPGGVFIFNNEYLFVQCEWEIIAATGNANSDVLFYVDSTGNVTTPDLALILFPLWHDDVADAFWTPSPIVLINTLVPAPHGDTDTFAVPVAAGRNTLAAELYSDTAETFFVPAPIILVDGLVPALHDDIDTVLSTSVGSQETIYAPHHQDMDNTLGPDEVSLNSLWAKLAMDVDLFSAPRIAGGKQKPRLIGSMGSPGYMVGNTAGSHTPMSGSTHTDYGKVA